MPQSMRCTMVLAAATGLLALLCAARPAAAAAAGECLDLPPVSDPASAQAYLSGPLAHFAYSSSYYNDLSEACANDCPAFRPLFAGLAQNLGAIHVGFVNGQQSHLNAMVVQTPSNVYLVFRGTEWPQYDPVDIQQDQKTNLTEAEVAGQPVGVHQGIAESLDEVYGQLVDKLDKFGAGPGGSSNLIITGHSLGGSLSALAAVRLAADGFNVSAVYTWAAGRVGDDRFAQLYRDLGLQDKTLRFTGQGDIVPLMDSPALTPYRQVGRLVLVANDTCSEDDALEEGSYCRGGLAPDTAAQPGVCRGVVLPYMQEFAALTPRTVPGGDPLHKRFNAFMFQLLAGTEELKDALFASLDSDPSWCCAFEQGLAAGGLDGMVMAVALAHGLPTNYLRAARNCIADAVVAARVAECMLADPYATTLAATGEA